ncbi:TIGR00266 family protein [Crocosphaera sp.]|uniref:TIGR00266 family protein n=1 Tax=Crocosphaera sp. TaxID=2729996 RepID=UPI003F22B46C|nr:TIGR00266 family protein [Crocosphaera sp.]
MQYKIHGTVMQILETHLTMGESLYTESGGMAWMKGDIEMKTNTRGGLMAGIGRALAGESLFMTSYYCNSGQGVVAFTMEVPGTILDFQLMSGQSLICQRDAFMCAEETVELALHFRKKLGAGLFGGEGFVLQKITGPGKAFLEIPGEMKSYELNAGETLLVDPGHIALFEPTVNFEIEIVKGIRNVLFSGEGLFLAKLTGPGKVWLQSMPLANLAAKLAKYIPSKS